MMMNENNKKVLENSIIFFEKEFSSLRENRKYKEYQKELELQEKKEEKKKEKKNGVSGRQQSFSSIVKELSKSKKKKKESDKDWITYDSIMSGLKHNIQSNARISQTILDSLKKMKMDFYIEYETGVKIYPLIVDMLNDLFMLEYFFHHQKRQTRPLISEPVWPEVIEEYEEDVKSYKYLFFAKLVRIQEIGPRNERPYFLAEYARTLNVDIKELRLLMQNIFFPTPEKHSGSFGLKFDKISNIEPAPFFLEHTKMVIGGI